MADDFWKFTALRDMTESQWESLCDGCGKCCLNKLEDEETGEVAFTSVACRLLDGESCRCGQYAIRKTLVPECVMLTAASLPKVAYWLPSTCAYRLLERGEPLPAWHPLVSGSDETVHESGMSVRGWTTPEFEVDEEDWEDYIIEDL